MSERIKHEGAVALGKLGRGRPKTLSDAERAARALRAAEARKAKTLRALARQLENNPCASLT